MKAGSGAGGSSGRHNLPASLTTFLGRRDELRELAVRLGRYRIVTVTGAGGSGKTRLAVELARSLVTRFEAGAWLIELGQVDAPALVPSAAAGVLGVREQPGLSMADCVALALAGRHILLVLDNCEHVIEEAADLCDRLLEASENVRILATSREPLGVRGEARFPCPPLPIAATPGPARPGDADAAGLFAERARQVDPGFELTARTEPLVTRLVRRLDGMPLAIELAAAQLDVLTLEQLAEELDGSLRPLVNRTRGSAARQASLEASIDWSYRLLDGAEQAAFRRLSVFPAPFSRAAAAAAVGPCDPDLLSRLVRRSMIVPPRTGADGQSRYGMLDTLRTYGRARLHEAGESETVRAVVAGWATTEAERVAKGFERERTELAAAQWFDAEHDNLREILDWTPAADPVRGLRLACSIGPWWNLRGRFGEGRALLEAALGACEVPPVAAQTAAEVWIGRFALYTGNLRQAGAILEQAAQRAGEHQLTRELLLSLNNQAVVLVNTGRLDEACALASQVLATARDSGDEFAEAWAASTLSLAAQYRGDRPGSLAWARQSAAVPADRIPGETSRKVAQQLAVALEQCGDLDDAKAIHQEGLERSRIAGSRDDIAAHLLALARVQVRQSQAGPAAGHLAEAMGLYAEMGDRLMLMDCFITAAVWAVPRTPEAALTLLGVASTLAVQVGFPIDGDASTTRFFAGPLATARHQAGEATARSAERRGAVMPLASALDFVRNLLDPGSVPAAALTVRERELLDLVAQGLIDREIAQKLFISLRTVRSHLDRIRDKTGARRRADLTRLALKGGHGPP